jgi:inner membrane protein
MATFLTHAVVGAALAPFGPARVPRARLVVALVAMSILPDIDVVAFAVGIPYEHPFGHRGFTHSLACAALVAWALARWGFPSVPAYSREWWCLFATFGTAMASHGLLDALTDGGLGVGFLLPLDSDRYFFPARPLVVSPIGIRAFFDGPMRQVLLSELLWVWLPLAGSLGMAIAFRKIRSRAGEPPRE